MKFLEDNQAMACENCPSYGLDEITVTAPRETISAYKPGLVETALMKAQTFGPMAGFVANTVYNMANDAYMTAQFYKPVTNRMNLKGQGAWPDEVREAQLGLLEKGFLKGLPKVNSIQKLNAAQFSSKFKGSFVNKLPAQIRGYANKSYNYINNKIHSPNFIFKFF